MFSETLDAAHRSRSINTVLPFSTFQRFGDAVFTINNDDLFTFSTAVLTRDLGWIQPCPDHQAKFCQPGSLSDLPYGAFESRILHCYTSLELGLGICGASGKPKLLLYSKETQFNFIRNI